MENSIHEEHLSQPLQTKNKQFNLAVTSPSGYNGIFNVTTKNNKFCSTNTISDDDFIQISMLSGAYEFESLNNESRRIIIEEEHFTEAEYAFTIKPNFLTRRPFIEISEQGPLFSFRTNDSIRNLLGFNATTIYEKYNLSHNPLDILSFAKTLINTDNAQDMIFRSKRSRVIHNCSMSVDPCYKHTEKFRGGNIWFMMESKFFFGY